MLKCPERFLKFQARLKCSISLLKKKNQHKPRKLEVFLFVRKDPQSTERVLGL